MSVAVSAYSPLSLSPAIWLDGSDASSVTLVNSAVSQWNDKSGNGRHATQSAVGARPGYSATAWSATMPAITFSGLQWLRHSCNPAVPQGFTVLMVVQITTNANNGHILDGYNSFSRALIGQSGGNFVIFGGTAVGNGPAFNTSKNLFSGVFDGASSNFLLNGTSLAIGNFGGNSYLDQVIGGGAGGNADPVAFITGNIGEIIIFSALSVANREKEEGRLAWKWGTVASLPAAHPYKSVAP